MIKNISLSSPTKIILFLSFLLSTLLAEAQNGNLSGKVADSSGNPLVGATVRIGGKNRATKTNEQGTFSFQNVFDLSVSLIVSYVGFFNKEIKTSPGQTGLVITLAGQPTQGDEIIVTGVTDKRTAMSSSIAISTISAATIQKQVPLSAADLLRNVPGVVRCLRPTWDVSCH